MPRRSPRSGLCSAQCSKALPYVQSQTTSEHTYNVLSARTFRPIAISYIPTPILRPCEIESTRTALVALLTSRSPPLLLVRLVQFSHNTPECLFKVGDRVPLSSMRRSLQLGLYKYPKKPKRVKVHVAATHNRTKRHLHTVLVCTHPHFTFREFPEFTR
ncbi:hypothetical protein BDY19DRAFT_346285 [Irpex rosettiformis]|uniref:Uncharacterized protein n=1 Tax=Irpex rosettiformis TaxID=378272 RepID=A0ACB8TXB0_9APHY|nr:hypothetical protein BDY19DRAFT_346285 [Irpex rosettiformis]